MFCFSQEQGGGPECQAHDAQHGGRRPAEEGGDITIGARQALDEFFFQRASEDDPEDHWPKRHLPALEEETEQSQLLLHVIDLSDPTWREQVHSVEQVLAELGVEDIPMIQVFNKIDQLENCEPKVQLQEMSRKVWVSAKTKDGLAELKEVIAQILYGEQIEANVVLGPEEGKLRAQLYALDAIVSEETDEEGQWHLHLRMSQTQYRQLFADNRE